MKDKLEHGPNVADESIDKSSQQSRKHQDRTVFQRPQSQQGNDKSGIKMDDSTRVKPTAGNYANRQAAENAGQTVLRRDRATKAEATQFRQKETRVNNTVVRPPTSKKTPDAARQATNTSHTGETCHQSQKRVLKDRFTLEKVIGVGGMGVVYKAIDKLKVEARDREPFVAIKVLSEEFRAHPESFIALQRESRKTQRIAHPNVVKVYDFDRDGETVFMTMEYMEGVPLDQLIKQYSATGLPREEAWAILDGLCSALIYAHAEKIVHSDFKPGNIFVTDAGIPKIFDFGIARAVANVDRVTGKSRDKTVFDAGTLGALTPAYASLEMLLGKDPDTRDDIYALGCIAYEMLTGSHPYNRLPADEARKNKLKPRRINNIKNKQWRAIERALMFRREDRLGSVEEFYKLIHVQSRSVTFLLPTFTILLALGVSTYFIVNRDVQSSGPDTAQVDKIKFKIQYDLYKGKIKQLLSTKSFTPTWEDRMWEQVSGMMQLLNNRPDKWLSSARSEIYGLYIDQYNDLLSRKEYARAGELLSNAARYTDDTSYIDSEKTRLQALIKTSRQHDLAIENMRQRKEVDRTKAKKRKKRDDYMFGLALKNVNQQLECQSNLNMRELSIAIEKLKSIDLTRYRNTQSGIIQALSACISHVSKSQPERALEDKTYALRIFPESNLIRSIVIVPRDACNKSIAGLGARGERDICRDTLKGGGAGPAMVVIPGNGAIRTFAIGKYEITDRQINAFCEKTGYCHPLKTSDGQLPAVNINIKIAESYTHWLSRMTGKKYRLPTRKEWIYAARANGSFQDPNRNCALNSRGIEKGNSLVRANTGSQNGWGLVNYLGNAREWVYDKRHELEAVGGSYRDSMDACTINSVMKHSGAADAVTGFRVVRDVTR